MEKIPEGFNISEIINQLISQMPAEDPLKYLETMYSSVHPGFIDYAITVGKDKLSKLNNKKGSKQANVYFTLGSENYTRSRISGFLSGILWTEDYVRSCGESAGVTPEEIKTYCTVLRKMGLPQIVDTYSDGHKYTTKTYEAILSNWLLWLSRGSLASKTSTSSTITRSNKEVCEVLTSSVMNSYPAIPFTSYYLGTLKTDEDVLSLAEKFYKDIKFDGKVSDEFSTINQPSYLVTSVNAPVVSMVGHPLCLHTIGLTDANNPSSVEWFASFFANKEFEKICMKHNLTSKDVAKYMISTSLEKHEKNIENKLPIALFIKEQKITEGIYNLLRKSDGLIEIAKDVKSYYDL